MVCEMCMITKKTFLLLVAALTLALSSLLACNSGEEIGFGIYLIDSEELVLSEHHVKVYHKDTHTIELNEEGIRKWNSYMTYESIPKLKDTLFSRDFMLKIEGKEIYRGKFYSSVSSTSYSGVVIMDALVGLSGVNNAIRIEFGYPRSPSGSEKDPRDSSEVFNFFERRGLLESR